jgi:hypothetical protein
VRELADADRIRAFMREVGRVAVREGTCYFTGGATAVLVGWRRTTVDVDIELVPEQDRVLRELPRIKNELRLNVELASPRHFIPVPVGWEHRSLPAGREGRLTFSHFDPYSQALAKLERAHTRDLGDVVELVGRGLVDRTRLLAFFEEIEPELYRFPPIDAADFRSRVEAVARSG